MAASLMPLLCDRLPVEYALELVEVTVLCLLGPKALDAAEKDEAVDATEFCLMGYGWSVCARWRPYRDMVGGR